MPQESLFWGQHASVSQGCPAREKGGGPTSLSRKDCGLVFVFEHSGLNTIFYIVIKQLFLLGVWRMALQKALKV